VHDLHVLKAGGPASGSSAWGALCNVIQWSFNINEIKGQAVKVLNMPDGGIGFAQSFLPPSDEVVEVAIVGASTFPDTDAGEGSP
jgi:hypothetical protein